MRYKVYFVISTDFHVPNFRREFDHTEHTVYQFTEADESTPIKDIIKAAESQFNINLAPEVATETLRFHSIYDADFQAVANSKLARESIARVRQSPIPAAPPRPAFGLEETYDQDVDVLCLRCSSKAVGVFKGKDGISRPLCRLHSALEAMK